MHGGRMSDDQALVFKDGPSGRRAALPLGPDVWEVVKALREVDECGDAAVHDVAGLLALSEVQIRVAQGYYAAHPAEIDQQISEADAASIAAEAAWRQSGGRASLT